MSNLRPADVALGAASVLNTLELLTVAREWSDPIAHKLQTVLTAAHLPQAALRLRAIFTDYQAQLLILLSKLSQPGPFQSTGDAVQDFCSSNITDNDLRSLLGKPEFDQFKQKVFRIRAKVERLATAVKIGGNIDGSRIGFFEASLIIMVRKLQKPLSQKGSQAKELKEERDITNIVNNAVTTRIDETEPWRDVGEIIEWDMRDLETDELLSDLECSLSTLKYLVGGVKDSPPDFSKAAVVVHWTLRCSESAIKEKLFDSIPGNPLVEPGFTAQSTASIPESIFFRYSRKPVPVNDFSRPEGRYRGICKLFMRFQNDLKTYIGTGWLIDSQTVATAAHNLYNREKKSHAVDVQVFIGYIGTGDANLSKIECKDAQSIAVHWGYYNTGTEKYDFALIYLRGMFHNPRVIPWAPTPLQVNEYCRVVGYPGDIPKGAEGQVMHESEGPILAGDLQANGHQLKYCLDTYNGMSAGQSALAKFFNLTRPGNSGSPVVKVLRGESNIRESETLEVIGVHSYGGNDINRASCLGYQGNNIPAFQRAFSLVASGSTNMVEEIQGTINGLKKVTVPLNESDSTSV